jgi:hypothetical protein
LRESAIKVCVMGKKYDWFWHERYHAAGRQHRETGRRLSLL